MYYPESASIAREFPRLKSAIEAIDEFLFGSKGQEFEARTVAEILEIALDDFRQILQALEEKGIVTSHSIWRCPKHREDIEFVEPGTLYCPSCERYYRVDEARSITLYSAVAPPEQASAPERVIQIVQSDESAETTTSATGESASSGVTGSPASRSMVGGIRVFSIAFTSLVLIGLMALLFRSCASPLPTASPTTTAGPVAAIIQNQSTERIAAERSSPLMGNCGGSGDAKRTISRGRETTVVIELNATAQLEASIAQLVKASIETQLRVEEGETISSTDSVEVNVAPRTSVQYEVQWYETWQTGDIVVDSLSLTIPYRVRVGYDADIIDSQDQPCPTTPAVQPSETLTMTPSATSTPTPSETASLTATHTLTSTSTNTHTPVPPTVTETASATMTVTPSPTVTSTLAPSWTPVPTSTDTSLTPEWMLPAPTGAGTEVQNPSWMLQTNTLQAGSGQYPCEGTVTGTGTNSLFVVYSRANTRQSPIGSVIPGNSVLILDDIQSGGRSWYQIMYGDRQQLGWVWDIYVDRSGSCPR